MKMHIYTDTSIFGHITFGSCLAVLLIAVTIDTMPEIPAVAESDISVSVKQKETGGAVGCLLAEKVFNQYRLLLIQSVMGCTDRKLVWRVSY